MKVVAEIKSWTNGSDWRKYQLEWVGQAETGDKLVTLAEAEAAVKQAREDALEEAKQACTANVDAKEEEASEKRVADALATSDESKQLHELRRQSSVRLFNCGIRKCIAAIESLKGKT